MLKWMGWVLRVLATALMLSFLSIWTTGYIVNSYMETLLKQLDLPLQTKPFALSGVWGKMWGADEPPPKAQESAVAEPRPSNEIPGSGSGEDVPVSSAGKVPDASAVAPSPEAQASGTPADESGDNSVPAFSGNGGILEMTDEQRHLLSTVMSKLNAEQLGKLSAVLENGLTEEEWKQAGDTLKPALTETEYGQIMELLRARMTPAEHSSQLPK